MMGKITIFIGCCLLLISNKLNAQQCDTCEDPILLGLGLNSIYDSGDLLQGIFQFETNYNFSRPFSISIEKKLTISSGVQLMLSSNAFLPGKNLNGTTVLEDVQFFSADAIYKYYFSNLFTDYYRSSYELYVAAGGGLNFYNTNSTLAANAGLGGHYFLTEKVYLNAQVLGKVSLDNTIVSTKLMQYNLGVVIVFKH